MDTAWMIRNDGRPFPVEYHIYADPEDGEDIMCAGEWLYQHTTCMWVRMLVLSMLVLWTKKETGGVFSYHRMLKYAGENVGFFPTADFLESIRNPITEMSYRMSWGLGDEEEKMLEQYYRTTLAQLNQEFLRARYGGMYDTESGCRDIIFRISSVGFDWYPIIQCFVKNCKLPIETVTIVRDAESTGMHNARYRSSDGETYYDRMSVELFLAERKNGLPKQHLYIMQGGVKQQDRHIYAALYEGKSFEEILRMGSEKSIRTKIKKLGEEENRLVAGYLTINQK